MSKRTALVVEDQFIIAMELEHRLSSAGFLVVGVASTGELAVVLSSKHRPDVILMDIQLKGELDGIDTAREIIASQAAKFVFITANDDHATRARAGTVPNSSYLTKPFSEEALFAALAI